MIQLSLIITLLSTCGAAFVLISGFSGSNSAPQQAAVAALAVAMAVIPYVFSRCLQIDADRRAQQAALNDILATLKAAHPDAATPPPTVAQDTSSQWTKSVTH